MCLVAGCTVTRFHCWQLEENIYVEAMRLSLVAEANAFSGGQQMKFSTKVLLTLSLSAFNNNSFTPTSYNTDRKQSPNRSPILNADGPGTNVASTRSSFTALTKRPVTTQCLTYDFGGIRLLVRQIDQKKTGFSEWVFRKRHSESYAVHSTRERREASWMIRSDRFRSWENSLSGWAQDCCSVCGLA